MTSPRIAETFKRTGLQEFERILRSRREALLGDVRGLEQEEARTAGTVSGLSIHSADLGTDRAAHDVSLGCMESAIDEVQEIDEALRRIQEGTFGLCEACGQEIGAKRLRAIPDATLCMACKMAEEAL